MEWFDRGKMVILRLTDLGIALLALGIILQLLFGNAMPFLGNDIAAQERHGGAEQHLQHDGERHQQKAQLRDLEDPGFGLVEHLHHLLFLRCSGIGEVPLHSIVDD